MKKLILTIAAITSCMLVGMTFTSCEDVNDEQEQMVSQSKSATDILDGIYSYKTDKGDFVIQFRNNKLINIKGQGRLLYKSSSEVEFEYTLFADTREGAAEAEAFVARLERAEVPCICQGTATVGDISYIMICYSSTVPCWYDRTKDNNTIY